MKKIRIILVVISAYGTATGRMGGCAGGVMDSESE